MRVTVAISEFGRCVLLLMGIVANVVNIIAFAIARQIINRICVPAAHVAKGIAKVTAERD